MNCTMPDIVRDIIHLRKPVSYNSYLYVNTPVFTRKLHQILHYLCILHTLNRCEDLRTVTSQKCPIHIFGVSGLIFGDIPHNGPIYAAGR